MAHFFSDACAEVVPHAAMRKATLSMIDKQRSIFGSAGVHLVGFIGSSAAAEGFCFGHCGKRLISMSSNVLILSKVEEYVCQSSLVVPAIEMTAISIPLLPQNKE